LADAKIHSTHVIAGFLLRLAVSLKSRSESPPSHTSTAAQGVEAQILSHAQQQQRIFFQPHHHHHQQQQQQPLFDPYQRL